MPVRDGVKEREEKGSGGSREMIEGGELGG